jgi:hypothetical protein
MIHLVIVRYLSDGLDGPAVTEFAEMREPFPGDRAGLAEAGLYRPEWAPERRLMSSDRIA